MNELVEKKITCPHCWHDFFGDIALYISQHAELFGLDTILMKDDFSRFTPFEVKRNKDGRVLDTKGWEMVERACPRCHLQIPKELLSERPKFVSIVGAPRSGKTYFLNVMLHNLKNVLARQFCYTLDISDSHEKTLFLKNENTLFFSKDSSVPVILKKTEEAGAELYNKVNFDGVEVQLLKPFTFNMRSTRTLGSSKPKQMSVVLYDNAGESFFFGNADDGKNRSTRHLGESDAVLFAYDPLLDPEARNRLASISKDPQLFEDKSISKQQEILTSVIHRMRKHSRTPDHKKLNCSLAVCVQKYDVWKPLLDYCKTKDGSGVIDHTSIEYFKQHGIAALDVDELNIASYLVKNFIEEICPEFVAAAEANFAQVRYFPVSSFGRSPIRDGEFFKIAPIDIQPFRVEHPMLWLLRDWRLIYRTKSPKSNPKNYPVASIREVTTDRIHINCPKTDELFVLDIEYSGSNFFNPKTCEYFWIPKTKLRGKVPGDEVPGGGRYGDDEDEDDWDPPLPPERKPRRFSWSNLANWFSKKG